MQNSIYKGNGKFLSNKGRNNKTPDFRGKTQPGEYNGRYKKCEVALPQGLRLKKRRYNKEKITIVIIDDLNKIRKRIIELLPKKLIDYEIEFIEFECFNGIKSHLIEKTRQDIEKNIFYILDKNFKKYETDEYPTKDTGLTLYKWVGRKKKEILDKVFVFSSSSEDEIKEKFGPKTQIIPGKSSNYTDDVHINEIARLIKEKMEVSHN